MESGPSPAAAADISVRRTADRRAIYRRSNTLSAFPLEALPAVSLSPGAAERQQPLTPIVDSPVRDAASTEVEVIPREERTRPQSAGRASVHRHGGTSDGTAVGRRAQFCRKTSCNDLLLSESTGGGGHTLYLASAGGGLVSGGSGRLLTKVKERIRDTVLQTTSEWHLVVQERRQRATIQFEMQAAKMMADEQQRAAAATETAATTAGDATESQRRSPVTVAAAVDRKEAARAAFRRTRSVSCDDTITAMLDDKLHPASAAAATASARKTAKRERRGSPTTPNNDVTGIVCSTKDLQSIIELSRQQTVTNEAPTSGVRNTSADSVERSGQANVVVPAVVAFHETPDERSPGTRRRPTADENSVSPTVELLVEASPVSEAQPADDDRDLAMPLAAGGSDDIPTTSSGDLDSATASESADAAAAAATATATADRQAQSTSEPTEVAYDGDGQTWDVYGAELNPEILGDAIQRHLQHIMLTATSITGLPSPQVAAVAARTTTPRTARNVDDGASATAAAPHGKGDKSGDRRCQQSERPRNFFQRFLRSRTK